MEETKEQSQIESGELEIVLETPSRLKQVLFIAAIIALSAFSFAAYKAANFFDSASLTIASIKTPVDAANGLIVDVHKTVNEAAPKVLNTLDSVKSAADEGKQAMINAKSASTSLRIAAQDSQEFYQEQLKIARSDTVKETFAEALVGVRNFSAAGLNANLILRNFRMTTQPNIDKIIDQANISITEGNKLLTRPAIASIIDNSADISKNFAGITKTTDEKLPMFFDNANKITLHAGGIAESIDTIGKRISRKPSKIERIGGFFLQRAIENAPILFSRIKF